MIDLTPIIEALITLIAAIIAAFVVPYLKSKISAEKYDELTKWVNVAVEAAEMIYTGVGRGAEKKAYVIKFLEDKGYTLDAGSINAMIESAVLGLQGNK